MPAQLAAGGRTRCNSTYADCNHILDLVNFVAENGGGNLIAYVDGSYEHEIRTYGYGIVVINDNGEIEQFCGGGSDPNTASLRNVAGELIAAMSAIRYAIRNGCKEIEIFYDYDGIEMWATGGWKTKKMLTALYAHSVRRWMEQINIKFVKVKGHTGDTYNEMADELAKRGILVHTGGENVEYQ